MNARRVLFDASVDGISLHASGGNTASNCGAVTTVVTPNPASNPPPYTYVSGDLAKACWAGGTIQVYVSPTLPTGTTYAEVRAAVVAAFEGLTDPANPGEQVVEDVLLKEELRNVQGADALHPNRSGDVVVVLRPPYQSDAATPGSAWRSASSSASTATCQTSWTSPTTSTCTRRSSPAARAFAGRTPSPASAPSTLPRPSRSCSTSPAR